MASKAELAKRIEAAEAAYVTKFIGRIFHEIAKEPREVGDAVIDAVQAAIKAASPEGASPDAPRMNVPESMNYVMDAVRKVSLMVADRCMAPMV